LNYASNEQNSKQITYIFELGAVLVWKNESRDRGRFVDEIFFPLLLNSSNFVLGAELSRAKSSINVKDRVADEMTLNKRENTF